MRVGVYVDAFNLYYGMKQHFNSPTGWKWLDLHKLFSNYVRWNNAVLSSVVYCTARVNDPTDPQQQHDQDIYLSALKHNGVKVVEGHYSSWAKWAPIVEPGSKLSAPNILKDPHSHLSWDKGLPIKRNKHEGGILSVRIQKREEKGSDVNLATHLLVDVFTKQIDAAIVVSNDTDLAMPLKVVRATVPTGLINPQIDKRTPHRLQGDKNAGCGGHWWRKLDPNLVLQSQFDRQVGTFLRPSNW